MKIDWSKAPEWAMWHAFDNNGDGFWFEKKPIPHTNYPCFTTPYKFLESQYNNVANLNDWYNSATERPEVDYTAQLLAVVEQQKAKGLAKYGVSLEDANLSALELVEHAIEEVTDQAMYLLALRDKLRKDAE